MFSFSFYLLRSPEEHRYGLQLLWQARRWWRWPCRSWMEQKIDRWDRAPHGGELAEVWIHRCPIGKRIKRCKESIFSGLGYDMIYDKSYRIMIYGKYVYSKTWRQFWGMDEFDEYVVKKRLRNIAESCWSMKCPVHHALDKRGLWFKITNLRDTTG